MTDVTPVTRPARTSLPRSSATSGGANAPRVTVIIPTHNREELVGRAVRGVLAQTLSDLEVILVDDASADGTPAAIAQLDDPRLQFVRLAKNRGQSRALNEGIHRALGEWVAFLDDDDEWLPDKLDVQLARVSEVPDASAVYCRCFLQTSDGLRSPRSHDAMPEGDITNDLLRRGFPMTPSAYVVRRGALLEVGGFDEALPASQDLDLWLRLSQAGHRFTSVPEPYVIYHAEHDKPGVSGNAAAQLRAFVQMDRRWGPLMRERLGVEEYERWRGNRTKKLMKANEKLVSKMERRGDRRAGWRYARAMWPERSGSFVSRALTVALLGGLPHRLRGRRRVPKEEPA